MRGGGIPDVRADWNNYFGPLAAGTFVRLFVHQHKPRAQWLPKSDLDHEVEMGQYGNESGLALR